MTTPLPNRPPRRFLQFSLRALLVFVLLVSIGMSWLAVKLEKARRQKEAVEAIEKAGGYVLYDYQSEDPLAQPPIPKWARALLGHHFFFDVVAVEMFPEDFGDDEAAYLKGLTNLTELDLSQSQITDAGLGNIKELANLKWLFLDGTQITDDGLEHLKGLTYLDWLDLSGTQVTPEGVKKLQEALPDCEIVY